MAQSPRRRLPKRSRDETRELMLRAATELVCAGLEDTSEEAISAALAHVQLTEVAARATRIVRSELAEEGWVNDVAAITTGAIYQVWATQAEFQADLLFYIADLDATFQPVIDDVLQIARDGIADGQPIEDTLAAMIRRSFEHTRGSAVFYASLCFYLHSGNQRVQDVLSHGEESFLLAIRPVYQLLLDGYHLRMRDTCTIDDLATTIAAIIEGFALHWKRNSGSTRDPLSDSGSSLVGRAAIMIFDHMTRPYPRERGGRADAIEHRD